LVNAAEAAHAASVPSACRACVSGAQHPASVCRRRAIGAGTPSESRERAFIRVDGGWDAIFRVDGQDDDDGDGLAAREAHVGRERGERGWVEHGEY
jgi:hypothetical protein